MCDFILFIVLLILIAASVALVFLILFADSSKKNVSENVINYSMPELTDKDIELVEKFHNTFSAEEIDRFKEIYMKKNICK